MATFTRPQTTQTQTAWQSHRYTESTDSETSFFDAETSTPCDDWSGYFEGWDYQTRDNYCPQIASPSNSPVRAGHASTPKFVDDNDELLPTACPRRRHRSEGNAEPKHQHRDKRNTINTKRFGMVACADPQTGDGAITQLNKSLQNSMSNTEDILSAMYNPDWDVASLQKWYHQSPKTPADLALLKIMFSLRYTAEEIVPTST